MTAWLIQLLNGLSFGMVLFLLSAGLSLIYGLMRIVNLSHGTFYILGGYIALSVLQATGSFALALAVAGLAVALFGAVMERLFLRRFHLQELPQVLMTFGFLFAVGDFSVWLWGADPQIVPIPHFLTGSIPLGDGRYPLHRLALIAVGLAVGAGLWWFHHRTRIGAMIRAAVDDEETARAVGINVSLLFSGVFALGAFLAALAGVLGGTVTGLYPGADFDVLLLAFVVVVIGGLGSLEGAFIGALAIGLIDTFGRAFFPQFALFTIFAPMALILCVRPRGLFGSEI